MTEVEVDEIAVLIANGIDPQTIAKYRNAPAVDQKRIDDKAGIKKNLKEDPTQEDEAGF